MPLQTVGKLQRRLNRATSSARQSMAAFRENRKTMGFVQVSAYVPASKRQEHSLTVKRMQAEYFMELLDRKYDDPAKLALAQCNYASLPDITQINEVYNNVENADVRAVCKEIVEQAEQFNIARSGLRLLEHSEEEVVNFAARAVAHNAMASYLWEYLAYFIENDLPSEVNEHAESTG